MPMLRRIREKKTKNMLSVEQRYGQPIEIVLRREYIENNHTLQEVGEMLGFSHATIRQWLKIFDIPIRGWALPEEAINV